MTAWQFRGWSFVLGLGCGMLGGSLGLPLAWVLAVGVVVAWLPLAIWWMRRGSN